MSLLFSSKRAPPAAPQPKKSAAARAGGNDGSDRLFAWGWNGANACGLASSAPCADAVTEPAEIPQLPGGHGISEVSAGPFHTTVLAHSGSVFGFGDGALGQLGRLELDANHRSPLPRLIPGLNHIAVRSVSCGAYHTALTDEIGDLWTFGSNEKGQLGIGNLPLTALEKLCETRRK